ncbi:MAG: DUF501 domain-containing protein [Gammaproteobacteria bacterium]|nr:DUF501 domain-containing protein [Gammaproteobacteria bacterium]
MPEITRKKLIQLGYFEGLKKKGIGGIANFCRVRCLHTYYAAHLIRRNAVGDLIQDKYGPV